jgi:hypothetical protein
MKLRKELVETLACKYVEATKSHNKELLNRVELDIRTALLSLDEWKYLDVLRSEVKTS